MIELLITCRIACAVDIPAVEALQREVWRRSLRGSITGFFVRAGDTLVGYFEGDNRPICASVEKMLRQRIVDRIDVVRENPIAVRAWTDWSEGAYLFDDLPRERYRAVPDLASKLPIPLEHARTRGYVAGG
ncbi:MAG: hypothetical protein AAF761_04195 [Pseudomonadota bacterium]